jgi:hypothetical protein
VTPTWTLIEKPSRVFAVDVNGVEICGARQPYGHSNWTVYVTTRVTGDLHQVLATTRDAALAHVRMIAELFIAANAAVVAA